MSLLETVDLGVRFGGVVALHDFNVAVDEGEIHGFIGPNGSGKSTLFNLIIGRHKPRTGQVLFQGESLSHLSPDQRARRGISIKFQTTSVFPGLSVLENLMLGIVGAGAPLRDLRRKAWSSSDSAFAEEMLETVGLFEKSNHLAGALGHGEKGWLEIGVALATRPKLLLLDEPTSGMGPDETNRTIELIRRIRSGLTILVIEHDMEFVRAVAEKITVLFRGGLLTQGTYDDVKNDERVIDAYLGRGREGGLSES
jgi:urea transport system ATP-binding protein